MSGTRVLWNKLFSQTFDFVLLNRESSKSCSIAGQLQDQFQTFESCLLTYHHIVKRKKDSEENATILFLNDMIVALESTYRRSFTEGYHEEVLEQFADFFSWSLSQNSLEDVYVVFILTVLQIDWNRHFLREEPIRENQALIDKVLLSTLREFLHMHYPDKLLVGSLAVAVPSSGKKKDKENEKKNKENENMNPKKNKENENMNPKKNKENEKKDKENENMNPKKNKENEKRNKENENTKPKKIRKKEKKVRNKETKSKAF
eukprot:CAMPEP_0113877282 /NCGR_PEP_ID=MMETSP0780_2-20120614/6000_1 /TAXON_ID=652834 /ORGANISM="Palpitomonas bilix" /LENGTH=260 /DNA_ID=CAMNT_0000863543 /DNA_START=420 /DNA_END=1203 /DNA_ORIENTATION=- /assembly_acc=CAM_ASM_000599